MAAVLVFAVVFVGVLATLYYLAEDQQDDTINVDQFRRERAAVISQMQQDQRARFIQRHEERGA